MMRYMLSEANREFSFLKDEISYIKNYLELSDFSMAGKNFIKLTIVGSVSHQKVPALIFIPIIENAIKHCDRNRKGTGIDIRFDVIESVVKLKSGNFIKRGGNHFQNNGFGLQNLKKRLDLIYGENYKLEINNTVNEFVVKLEIAIL